MKELTIKEKILISLEESNRPQSRLIGGFVGVLFACAITERSMSIMNEQLNKVEWR